MFDTPVAFIVFNRPATTRQVFEAIARARPKKLLVIADGPRPSKPGEAALCRQVREIFDGVDWPCELSTNFAESNLGCQERVISGLDWVFCQVEEAVILEDDCLPDPSFFPFCQELLERFRGDSRVAAISGTNFLSAHFKSEDSYYFSRLGGIWGWATWRSEWLRYDRMLRTWPTNRRDGMLKEIFPDSRAAEYWGRIFDTMHATKGLNVWGYQWLYTHLINNSVTAVPRVNLVANIGFGPDSTHTRQADSRLLVPTRPLGFPLQHPSRMIPLRSMDRKLQKLYSLPINHRIARKMQRVANRIFGSSAGP